MATRDLPEYGPDGEIHVRPIPGFCLRPITTDWAVPDASNRSWGARSHVSFRASNVSRIAYLASRVYSGVCGTQYLDESDANHHGQNTGSECMQPSNRIVHMITEGARPFRS